MLLRFCTYILVVSGCLADKVIGGIDLSLVASGAVLVMDKWEVLGGMWQGLESTLDPSSLKLIAWSCVYRGSIEDWDEAEE
jgi:hypothetical protein